MEIIIKYSDILFDYNNEKYEKFYYKKSLSKQASKRKLFFLVNFFFYLTTEVTELIIIN